VKFAFSLGVCCLSTGLFAGCGEGERLQSGTQVQVTRDMEAEAKASDAFLTEQAKTKKKGGGGGPDNKVVPGPDNKVVPGPSGN